MILVLAKGAGLPDLFAYMEAWGYLLAGHSDWLRQRNWLQICLMGAIGGLPSVAVIQPVGSSLSAAGRSAHAAYGVLTTLILIRRNINRNARSG